MVGRSVPFGTIKDRVPAAKEWRDLIPVGKHVQLSEMAWGHEISSASQSPSIPDPDGVYRVSILVNGTAEICEEYELKPQKEMKKREIFTCPHAYRPIRRIEAGDLFGDFKMVDRAIFPATVTSRPFEDWKIVYGGRSAIFVLDGQKKPPRDLFEEEEPVSGGRAVHHLIDRAKKGEKALVAEIVWNKDEPEFDSFLSEVLKSAWKRAYTYRLASNSYNIHHKFVFMRRARAAIGSFPEQADNSGKKQYPYSVAYSLISGIFLEAIYDAINRPIRDEPIFAFVDRLGPHPLLKQALQFGRILLPVRISKHPEIKEFYFPIGLSNFLVVNFAAAQVDMPDLYGGFTAEAPKAPEKVDGAYFRIVGGQKRTTKGNGMHFWKTVAETVVASHGAIDAAQDKKDRFGRSEIEKLYTLSVVALPSFDGRCELFLKYTRTSERPGA
ncbi:MAG: hypothetical protein QOH47_2506 [Sphingomonadales bacterium]|jgi:hypothetical protein|nr:hypothetical protein [Sphingomonadales bacterium]